MNAAASCLPSNMGTNPAHARGLPRGGYLKFIAIALGLSCAAPAQAASIDQLSTVDRLGFVCVREADLDAAFHATGKGLRLPPTCLDNPCAEELTRAKLARHLGHAPRPDQWERYFSAYADRCRAEVTPFGAPLPGAAPLFHGPLTFNLTERATATAVAVSPVAGRHGGPKGWHPITITAPAPPAVPGPHPTPMPLPGSAALLLAALAGLFFKRKIS